MNVQPDATQGRAAPARAKRLRIPGIVLGSLAFCGVLGIVARGWIGYRKRTQALLWYRPSSEAPADLQWQELDPARIHRVVKEKQSEAIERLEEVAVIERLKGWQVI